MTVIVNTAQSEAWNGYEGRHWAGHADRYDGVNGGFNEPILAAAAVGPDDHVLDIGCGSGQLTRLAARRAAAATGLDLSDPMLARARSSATAEQLPTVSFVCGDAQIYPFATASFDVALSRCGVMFFADPVAAFVNIARALRPGGRLACVAPAPIAGSAIGAVFVAAAAHLPGFEVGHGSGPFSDPAGISALLASAGFIDIAVCELVVDSFWGADADDAVNFIIDWGPMRHHRECNGFGTDPKVRAALRAALAPDTGPAGVWLPANARLITATTPPP